MTYLSKLVDNSWRIEMLSKKYINLHKLSNEKLLQDLEDLLKHWSSSSSNLNRDEFARIKSIALELKRRGIITKEVEQVLKEI